MNVNVDNEEQVSISIHPPVLHVATGHRCYVAIIHHTLVLYTVNSSQYGAYLLATGPAALQDTINNW
jgi:hypothetical protein